MSQDAQEAAASRLRATLGAGEGVGTDPAPIVAPEPTGGTGTGTEGPYSRTCKTCGETKPLNRNHFYSKRDRRTGRSHWSGSCIECERAYSRAYNKKQRTYEGEKYIGCRVDEQVFGEFTHVCELRDIPRKAGVQEALELWLRREETRQRIRYEQGRR